MFLEDKLKSKDLLILEKISITFLCSLGTAKHLTGCCNYKLAVYLLTIRSMVVVSCMSNASKPHLQSADQDGRQSLRPSRHQGSLSRQSTKVSTVFQSVGPNHKQTLCLSNMTFI